MKKLKSAVSIILCLMFVSLSVFCLAGCGYELKLIRKKEAKYDVTIRLGCECCYMEYIFTPDIDEMFVERRYDGREHHFTVLKYQLVDHPRWDKKWITPGDNGGKDTFLVGCFYIDEQGNGIEVTKVKEKGEYHFNVRTSRSYDLWEVRNARLVMFVT